MALALVAGLFKAKVALAQVSYQGQPLQFWVDQLGEEDFESRRRAVYALSQIGEPAAENVDQIAALLKDRHMEVRWYAADALGEFGAAAESTVPDLVAAIKSTKNDNTVRARAARSLGKVGPAASAAAETLQTAQDSDDPVLRTAAAEALWRIQQDKQSLQVLAAMVREGDTDAALAAAATIARLDSAQITPTTDALVVALGRDDIDVRRAAVHALVAAGPAAVPAIGDAMSKLPGAAQTHAAVALGLIADQVRAMTIQSPAATATEVATAGRPLLAKSIPALTRLLVSDNSSAREAATHAMARHGLIAAPQLIKALTSNHPRGTPAAALALSRMEKYLPVGETSSALQNVQAKVAAQLLAAMGHSKPQVQLAAVRLFAAMRIGDVDADAQSRLRKLLTSSDVEVRRYADRSLKNIESNSTP